MTFENYYSQLLSSFKKKQNLSVIKGTLNPIEWPDFSGVYIVFDNSSSSPQLIYVGMTGKFHRNQDGKVSFNEQKFKSRKSRWTPYRFCESTRDGKYQFSFRFNPKLNDTNAQAKIKYENDAYSNTVPYPDLTIHCFHIEENHSSYTPSLLEAEILTKYLKQTRNLPPGNRQL